MSPLLPLVIGLLGQAPASGRVMLVFGGDVIPHEPVKRAAKVHARHGEDAANHEGWDHVFGPLSLVFRRADLAVVNLETPITTARRPLRGNKVFNAAPSLLGGLKAAGVSVATFANNHCRDQGLEGIAETRRHLEEAGLLATGAAPAREQAWQPLVVERNGLKLGFLSFTRSLNGFENTRRDGDPFVPVVPYPGKTMTGGTTAEELAERVRAISGQVDALVVTAHWGVEYAPGPRVEDRALAGALIEAGAVAVVGHHPHVLQSVEPLRRADGGVGLVAFSLGNLVSNQDMPRANSLKRDGMLLEVELLRDAATGRVRLGKVVPVPLWTENRAAPGKPRNVQPVLLDQELGAMDERLVTLAGRTDRASRAEARVLAARRALALARRVRILGLMSPPWAEGTGSPVGLAPGSSSQLDR